LAWLENGSRYGYGWQGISLGMDRFGRGMALGMDRFGRGMALGMDRFG